MARFAGKAPRVTGSIDFAWRGEQPWLTLTGDIDIEVAEPVTDAVLADYQTAGLLMVDAAGVTFVDSIGIGLLLRLRHVSGSVRLMAPPPELTRVLQLCGVAGLFEVEPAAA